MSKKLFAFTVFSALILSLCSVALSILTDVTNDAGVTAIGTMSEGVGWGDFNGDGFLDIFVANFQSQNAVYINNGDGTFTNTADQAGVSVKDDSSQGMAIGDFDNDGDLDVYLTEYGERNRLYRNNGSAVFFDVARDANLGDEDNGMAAAFLDYDNDGWLDIYVVNDGQGNRLYHNEGDGTFGDDTFDAAVGYSGEGRDVVVGDYNNDGHMDIYVVNDGEPNVLYRNDGDGMFVDVSAEAGVNDSGSGRTAAFGDVDNDGDLDLYLANGDMNDVDTHVFFVNKGDGTFEDGTRAAKMDVSGQRASVTFLDYDNDADLDICIIIWGSPNVLYSNNGDGTFMNVARDEKLRKVYSNHATAFADYDNDGDLDMFLANSTFRDQFNFNGAPNALYRNDLEAGNNWLHIELQGIVSNRSAIGARIAVTIAGVRQMREITSGGLAQDSLVAEFGLGQAQKADMVQIEWPSGEIVSFGNVEANQLLVITEGLAVEPPSSKLIITWGRAKSSLYQNYPNPFNPETWIPYQLAEDADVSIKIHNVAGQLVRTLHPGHRPAGLYISKHKAAYWDGKNEMGEDVSSGVYFYTIQAADLIATKTMAISR